MKTNFSIVLMCSALFALLPLAVSAQVQNPMLDNPKYGPDKETRQNCLKNTSFYTEYYKQGNYKDAAAGWQIVFQICPRSSENIYIRGARMIKKAISQCTDANLKTKLVDSLLTVYSQRMKYFHKDAYNLANMGTDLYMYEPTRLEEARGYLERSLALDGDGFDPQASLVLMKITTDRYAQKKIPADSVIAVYTRLNEIFGKQIAANPDDEKLKPMSESLDAMFTGAGVANCENLVSIYTPKLEADSSNVDLARSIYNQLAALRCTDSELYLRAATILFRSAPLASLGNEIARIYVAKHMNADAEYYFRGAIKAEQDSIDKSKIMIEYASFVGSNMGEVARARSLALEALRINPSLGLAYYLIGTLYAGTKNCGNNKMDNASVYWAAVDKFIRAKEISPSLTADCNKQINYLEQFFPKMDDIFFNDLAEGDTYTVPCWINEKTRIRARK